MLTLCSVRRPCILLRRRNKCLQLARLCFARPRPAAAPGPEHTDVNQEMLTQTIGAGVGEQASRPIVLVLIGPVVCLLSCCERHGRCKIRSDVCTTSCRAILAAPSVWTRDNLGLRLQSSFEIQALAEELFRFCVRISADALHLRCRGLARARSQKHWCPGLLRPGKE